MSSSRNRKLLFVLCLLVAAGFITLISVRKSPESATRVAVPQKVITTVARNFPVQSSAVTSMPEAPQIDRKGVYYSMTFELCLQGSANDLDFSEDQIAFIQRSYIKFVEDRLALEASIATITSVSDDKTEIEIPSYADAGKILEDNFYKTLAAEFGWSLTNKFKTQYAQMVDADNYLVGLEPQEVTVTVVKPDGLYEVHHTIISSIFDRTLVDTFKPDNPGTYKWLMPLFPKI